MVVASSLKPSAWPLPLLVTLPFDDSEMNDSTMSRATESAYCTGGDFMKYELGAMRGPPTLRSSASLAHLTASMTTPAEFGESHTSSLSSMLMGISPNSRPSMRMYAHLRSLSHGTWSDGPMWMSSASMPFEICDVTDCVLEIFL